jgi:gentisate 1,2-dioxygenase
MDNHYITAYEYEKNVNPSLKEIPISKKNVTDCDYGVTFIDFGHVFNVDYKSTTPNLLASFIKIEEKNDLLLENRENNSFLNSTSHLFFIIEGTCEILFDNQLFIVSSGEILVTPVFNSLSIKNINNTDLQIYYINDSPLINYLGSKTVKQIFKPSLYNKDFLLNNLQTLSNPNSNRKGILLSNKDTEKIGTNTITPILWALYNELPPNTVQRPHKHNSVALDLCISCSDSENIYTLLGDELDENGNILNPIKINWKKGEMFITPPGLWHSHNNKGNTFSYILPIQDAGLLLYQRILGIVLL